MAYQRLKRDDCSLYPLTDLNFLSQVFSLVKHKNTIIDGAKILFEEVRLVREVCTEEERRVAEKVIQNNAYFAHPENIIIAMCGKFK